MTAPAAPTTSLKILLVEDLPVVRTGLARLLRLAFDSPHIFEADTVRLACAHIAREAIDLALVDIGLPDGSGLEVVRKLRSMHPDAICVMSTVYDDDAHVFPALEAGADGYLLKERPETELISALRGARADVPALTPSIARKLMQHFRVANEPSANPDRVTPVPAGEIALTKREREVLAAVGLGKRVSTVAAELGISDNTVAGYIKEIYRKLHITSRAQAALEARKRGLV